MDVDAATDSILEKNASGHSPPKTHGINAVDLRDFYNVVTLNWCDISCKMKTSLCASAPSLDRRAIPPSVVVHVGCRHQLLPRDRKACIHARGHNENHRMLS